MIISDLSYLESVSNGSAIKGSDGFDYRDYVPKINYGNVSSIHQRAVAMAGNSTGSGNISIGNVAIALNIAVVTQINL